MRKNKRMKKIIIIIVCAVLVILGGMFAIRAETQNEKIEVLVTTKEIKTGTIITKANIGDFTTILVDKNSNLLKEDRYDSFETLLNDVIDHNYITDSKILIGNPVYQSYFKIKIDSDTTLVDPNEDTDDSDVAKITFEKSDFSNPVIYSLNTTMATFAPDSIDVGQRAFLYGTIIDDTDGEKTIFDLLVAQKNIVNSYIQNEEDSSKYDQIDLMVEASDVQQLKIVNETMSSFTFLNASSAVGLEQKERNVNELFSGFTGSNPVQTVFEEISTDFKKIDPSVNKISFLDSFPTMVWRGKVKSIYIRSYKFDGQDEKTPAFGILTIGDGIQYNKKTDEYSLVKPPVDDGYYNIELTTDDGNVIVYKFTVEKTKQYSLKLVSTTINGLSTVNKIVAATSTDYSFSEQTPMEYRYNKSYFANISDLKGYSLSEDDVKKIYDSEYEFSYILNDQEKGNALTLQRINSFQGNVSNDIFVKDATIKLLVNQLSLNINHESDNYDFVDISNIERWLTDSTSFLNIYKSEVEVVIAQLSSVYNDYIGSLYSFRTIRAYTLLFLRENFGSNMITLTDQQNAIIAEYFSNLSSTKLNLSNSEISPVQKADISPVQVKITIAKKSKTYNIFYVLTQKENGIEKENVIVYASTKDTEESATVKDPAVAEDSVAAEEEVTN